MIEDKKEVNIEIEVTQEIVEDWCEENGYALIRKYKEGETRPMTAREIKAEGIKGIIERVAKHVEMKPIFIQQKTRKREVVEARQLVHAIAKEHLMMSLSKIGWAVGKKDHATVLHSAKTVRNLIDTDLTYRNKYDEIINLYSL